MGGDPSIEVVYKIYHLIVFVRTHPPYTPYSIGNSSRVVFKTIDLGGGGTDNSQSHSTNVFRVDDPRSEPRVLHELTLKKMAEDAESDIAICFVHENY